MTFIIFMFLALILLIVETTFQPRFDFTEDSVLLWYTKEVKSSYKRKYITLITF